MFTLLRDAGMAFTHDRASRLAAAVTYYAIFALAPLLFLLVVIAGFFLDTQDVQRSLQDAVARRLGPQEARLVTSLIERTEPARGGVVSSAVGVVMLFLGATGLFEQLRAALNAIWGADPPPRSGFSGQVRSRLVAFALVVLFALLVMVFIVGSTLLASYARPVGEVVGMGPLVARASAAGLTVVLFTLVFAVLFKVLPDVPLSWRDVLPGAFVTSLLFTVGQTLLSLYFAHVSPGSMFGAAGSLIAVLLWMYYSAQMLFFGAEVTWVMTQRYGTRAGGAFDVQKKAALARLGASVDPTPSPAEQTAASDTPGAIPADVNAEIAARAARDRHDGSP